MTFLSWRDGPKEMGCVYHKRGVHRNKDGDIVVDVFVMPDIVHRRPIAITIGRYQNYRPIGEKQQTALQGVQDIAGCLVLLSEHFEAIGCDGQMATYLADEVEQLLREERTILEGALKSART